MRGFVRVWNEVDLKNIEKSLIVIGELSSECFACHSVGIPHASKKCPHCGIPFKYMAFRRRINQQFIAKMKNEAPQLILIDFDDFKRGLGKHDARRLLDI